MAQATSISLRKFTASVQSAVKAAVARHPKFKVEAPHAITISYLIRGFPVPEAVLAAVTVAETQAFANEVAGHIAAAHGELAASFTAKPQGAVFSIGNHLILGIPPLVQNFELTE